MARVHIPCPACDGTSRFTIGRGPFAPTYVCEECDNGAARCAICRAPATDAIVIRRSVTPLCDRCMAEEMEEADVTD